MELNLKVHEDNMKMVEILNLKKNNLTQLLYLPINII